jgi:uncharacterized OB-fold protein
VTISDREVFERLPGRRIDHDTVDFFRGWLQRRLVLSRCGACGRWRRPPAPVCPSCWSDDMRPAEACGDGVIHSLTLLRHADGEPRPLAVIELAEQPGLRVTATIVGCPPSGLRIGLPVRLTWIERGGEPSPAFTPAS